MSILKCDRFGHILERCENSKNVTDSVTFWKEAETVKNVTDSVTFWKEAETVKNVTDSVTFLGG
jgi:hypothetical protein